MVSMTRVDFFRIAAKTLQDFIHHQPQDRRIRVVRMTSGTSGNPLVFIRELPRKMPGWFVDINRPVLCGGSLPARLGLALFFKLDTNREASLLLLDSSDFGESLTDLLHDFEPDIFVGFTSILAQVSSYLDHVSRVRVRALVMTGENLTSSLKDFFVKLFPQAIIRMQYLIQELGYVGSPVYCPYIESGHYHPAEGVYLEILEPDESGVGELMVSTHFNEHIVLQRYRYGDLARLHTKSCPCGAHASFEIIGRSGYDFVRIVGATLRREEFDRIFGSISSVTDYRVIASTEEKKGRIHGKMEITLFGPPQDTLEDIRGRLLQDLFLTPTQTLGDLVQKGIFLAPILYSTSEPFPKKHKDIKLTQRA